MTIQLEAFSILKRKLNCFCRTNFLINIFSILLKPYLIYSNIKRITQKKYKYNSCRFCSNIRSRTVYK